MKKKEKDIDSKHANVIGRIVAVTVAFPRGKVNRRRKYETSLYIYRLREYKTSRPLARTAPTPKRLNRLHQLGKKQIILGRKENRS